MLDSTEETYSEYCEYVSIDYGITSYMAAITSILTSALILALYIATADMAPNLIEAVIQLQCAGVVLLYNSWYFVAALYYTLR